MLITKSEGKTHPHPHFACHKFFSNVTNTFVTLFYRCFNEMSQLQKSICDAPAHKPITKCHMRVCVWKTHSHVTCDGWGTFKPAV